MIVRGTELIIGVSRAKSCGESFFDVNFHVAPPKPDQNCWTQNFWYQQVSEFFLVNLPRFRRICYDFVESAVILFRSVVVAVVIDTPMIVIIILIITIINMTHTHPKPISINHMCSQWIMFSIPSGSPRMWQEQLIGLGCFCAWAFKSLWA